MREKKEVAGASISRGIQRQQKRRLLESGCSFKDAFLFILVFLVHSTFAQGEKIFYFAIS